MHINEIPDKYVGKFSIKGKWEWNVTNLFGPMKNYKESLWVAGDSGAYAKYEPKIRSVGKIRISAYMIGWYENQDTNMQYEIHYAGGVDNVFVDLSKYGKDESNWLVLGTYEFDGSATEYVQLTRLSNDNKNTRASTMRFEILNSCDENAEVWQIIYVGPSHNDYFTFEMAEFSKFSDMDDSPYKYCAETLAYLKIVDTEEDKFHSNELVTGIDFSNWISRAAGIDIFTNDDIVMYETACKIGFDLSKKLDKNLEWMEKSFSAVDFIEKSEMLLNIPMISKNKPLTRGEAAAFVKGFYHTFVSSGVDNKKWRLTFHDEFDGNEIRTDIWDCENAVSSHISSSRWDSNVKVENGSLKLLTKKEKRVESPQLDWTTGSVSVKPSVFSQYGGYWEASIKINASSGINNAFWMAGNGNEIDIVEAHYKNAVHTNYHYNQGQYSDNYNAPYDLSEDFHTYAVEWKRNEFIYFFDGKEISRKNNLAAHDKLFPYFSTAVLNWAGRIDNTADGKAMEVEWVRIYNMR